ncbi:PRC-barrel domain-containing protein [Nanoarchaeota archaeon]
MKLRKLRGMIGAKVFTDAGDYFGEIEEANLMDNKVDGWKIKVARDSSLVGFLGGAKGLIIPHQFVRAMGDIVIVSKSTVPAGEDDEILAA